ncbi:hypothetical protein K7432_016232 [Basidiobolus ranarum]|uniref:SERTA domain-containing protein n=1 Tax=Basidiobolus ranarum TaxID=34480 RepID=A0ABR2VLW2_9FUNG
MPSAFLLPTHQQQQRQQPSPSSYDVSSQITPPKPLTSYSNIMPSDQQRARYEVDTYPRFNKADEYEDMLYHLHEISQKKLLSITDSRIDHGVRKAVLISNLFRTLPASVEEMYPFESVNSKHESVPGIELEEQSWFDSCLDDLDDDEEEDFDNSDEEMEWSWASSNSVEESYMDYDSSLLETHSNSPYCLPVSKNLLSTLDPHSKYLPVEPQITQIQLSPTPEGQGYLSKYFFGDNSTSINNATHDQIGNTRKISLGCYANHLFYL